MWKSIIYCSLVSMALAGIIHDHHDFEEHHSHHEPIEETDHHHKVEHDHATSHQSFKIHHFHPVPVYVKKEDQHLLKHPIEVGGVHHKLKLLHPETKEHHGHGLVLENHTDEKDHKIQAHEHHFEHEQHHHEHEPIAHHQEHIEHDHHSDHSDHDVSHHQFHDINVHHGHHHGDSE